MGGGAAPALPANSPDDERRRLLQVRTLLDAIACQSNWAPQHARTSHSSSASSRSRRTMRHFAKGTTRLSGFGVGPRSVGRGLCQRPRENTQFGRQRDGYGGSRAPSPRRVRGFRSRVFRRELVWTQYRESLSQSVSRPRPNIGRTARGLASVGVRMSEPEVGAFRWLLAVSTLASRRGDGASASRLRCISSGVLRLLV